MTYCEQCGSTSFDEQGFCRGCGARPPGYAAAQASPATHLKDAYETYLPPQQSLQPNRRLWGLWGFVQPDGERNVLVSVLLALFLGPFGLTYSTYLGAFVMFVVSFIGVLFFGGKVELLILPICAVWAWFAARSANSIY